MGELCSPCCLDPSRESSCAWAGGGRRHRQWANRGGKSAPILMPTPLASFAFQWSQQRCRELRCTPESAEIWPGHDPLMSVWGCGPSPHYRLHTHPSPITPWPFKFQLHIPRTKTTYCRSDTGKRKTRLHKACLYCSRLEVPSLQDALSPNPSRMTETPSEFLWFFGAACKPKEENGWGSNLVIIHTLGPPASQLATLATEQDAPTQFSSVRWHTLIHLSFSEYSMLNSYFF